MTIDVLAFHDAILAIIHLMVLFPMVSLVSRDFLDGTVERWLSAGAKRHEIILSRLIIQFLVMLMQVVSMLAFIILVQFCFGELVNVGQLTAPAFLQGLQGITQGLAICSWCVDKPIAMDLPWLSFLTACYMSGESAPRILTKPH